MKSRKTELLRPNVFIQMEEQKNHAKKHNRKIYDFGIADPFYAPPQEAIQTLKTVVDDPKNNHYSALKGHVAFRNEMANWYKNRFDVEVDPDCEVLALLGSKEGLFDITMTYMEPGDVALVPDPSFPTYHQAVFMANGEIFPLPLLPENDYLPKLSDVPESIRRKARMMFLNYPHNPTGALATDTFIEEVIEFAKAYEIVVCYDNPFTELTFDGNVAQSFLQYKGAKEVGVEFTSFSKTFNMSGWRIGAIVGSKDIIGSLLKVHVQAHSSVFPVVQLAATEVLKKVWPTSYLDHLRGDYQEKLEYAMNKFNEIGWKVIRPKGAVYLWVPVPDGYTSDEFAEILFQQYNVLVGPGIGFGELGEGYIRLAMTSNLEDHKTGIDQLCRAIQASK